MFGTGQNSPRGFLRISNQGSITDSGRLSPYLIASGYATSIFRGDPVTISADGTIIICPAGTAQLGVFDGVQYVDAQGTPQYSHYWPASTVTQGTVPATALIDDDPDSLFSIQVSTATGTPGPVAAVSLAQADMFQNANFSIVVNSFNAVAGVPIAPNPTTGSTAMGQSAYYLNYGSLGTGATLNLKLIRFDSTPGNVAGVNFNNAIVKINNHIYNGGTGTAGV